jgi:lipopolysaccharide export system permease protein
MMKFKSLPNFSLGISIMDRYILTELLVPFLFGVGLFSSVAVAIGSVFDLVRRIAESGLLIELALRVLLLKMPQFIVYAFPMSMVLASLMAYSRLSSDSEIVALRSCGVSVYRLVVPALVMGVIVTGVTFIFYESVVPAANYQASLILEKAANEERPLFQERNIFVPEYTEIKQADGKKSRTLKRLFYADRFNGKEMQNLTILDWSQEGLNQIIAAQSAMWNPKEGLWDFSNGTIYMVSADGSYRNILRFKQQQLQLPRTPLDIAGRRLDYDEMNIFQSQEALQIAQASGDEQRALKLQVRIQQKIALPFICLVFGLVGSALGIQPRKTGKATSFGISVVIIFTYYISAFITGAMAQVGVVTPFWGGWLPNLFGLVSGIILLIRSAR